MPTMWEQVVSKVRDAAEGMPALQKRLLESTKEAQADWEALARARLPVTAALYVVFDNRLRCTYVGQTRSLRQRLRAHPKFLGDTVCFIRLKPSDEQVRKAIEGPLCRLLKPKFGTPFRDSSCDSFWVKRFLKNA